MNDFDDFDRLGERRHDIGFALSRLEEALARPITSRWEWIERVDLALDELLIVGRIQVSALLAVGGPLDDAVRRTPRLSGHVDRLREGLPAVERDAEDLQKQLRELEPYDVRRRLVRILGRVVGLRHLLADTVWEAYNVDLGGRG